MAAVVKPRELGLAKLIETGCVGVLGVRADERRLRGVLKRVSWGAGDAHSCSAVSVM